MFSTLSDSQREIVFNKSGRFVVRACPGSGKTYCVGARLARLINGWDKKYEGIAVVSFTNVAWQEIENKCCEKFAIDKIAYPHFLGTIDSFINKYIFLPFGHLILGCKCRPVLVGEPHGTWSGGRYERDYNRHFDICSFDIAGNLIPTTANMQAFGFSWSNNKGGNINGNVKNLEKSKKKLLKAGYATQSDANFFAMIILEKYPQIAKSLVARFPYLIVDEAQDTSDVQMRIIDLLIQNGLNEVMLVGDPDQAIFEWNDARPELLVRKYQEWPDSIVLNESRRSSQNICNFTFGISSLEATSTSVNEDVCQFPYTPKIITYNNNLPEIVADFIGECQENGIDITKDNISVIYRSHSLVNDILGIEEVAFGTTPWIGNDNSTREFAKGKYLYDNGNCKDGFRMIERALLKQILNLSYCSDNDINNTIAKMGFINYRTQIQSFINILPDTSVSIGEWVRLANTAFTANKCGFQLSLNNDGKDYSFDQLFLHQSKQATDINYRLGTVHSVKGETFDATLLILKKKGVGAAYKTILNKNVPISENEELRIAYVGMTRPRKILVIAVPDDENKRAWESRLVPAN